MELIIALFSKLIESIIVSGSKKYIVEPTK